MERARQRLVDLGLIVIDPTLWDNAKYATSILKEKKILDNLLSSFDAINNGLSDNVSLLALMQEEAEEDPYIISQIDLDLQRILKLTQKLEIESLFSGSHDANNCFVEIHAGAGGVESHDWASMMMRMYLRFAEKMHFKPEIISVLDGEEAGIKSCCIKIKGDMAYGWFRTESGVHRLVRISPFNAAGKRMTSFASCWVYPEIEDDIDILIEPKDLRIDTYRASGAGGQHVNTTDSAVRITHIPTNIAVQCQNDRSQHRNKDEAMRMLKSRLFELEMKKKNDEIQQQNAQKTDNSWGHQIRSYVLQPYQMVKDLRTNYETSNAANVLDGDLTKFISHSLSLNKKV